MKRLRVLVIMEDFHQDEHIVLPILESLFQKFDIKATVRPCRNPNLGSVSEALKINRIEQVVELYRGNTDLFLVVVDRDGLPNRRAQLNRLEEHFALAGDAAKRRVLAVEGWQEIEVWLLAGMNDLSSDWSWTSIRNHPHPKEAYYVPYARSRGFGPRSPYGGRDVLGREAASHPERILRRCSEDLDSLIKRIVGGHSGA
jgi:hypothetical protein